MNVSNEEIKRKAIQTNIMGEQYKEGKQYIKQMHIPEGMIALSHSHKYNHYSILAKGHALVVVDGEKKEYFAGDIVLIKARQEHQIHALTDITWFCLHVTDEEDLDQIDETLIGG